MTPPDGEEWLARTLTEQLPLHPWVVTDAQLVEERLDQARLEPPARAIDTLRPAVEMITGMPFADTSYLWPDAEGITSNLVLLAISASAELAGHALSIGDTELVFWATGQGLAVLPGHEELIALRMRAHARSGDLAGVRQEWESYERVIVADPWSDGEPAPKLLALRRELLSTAQRMTLSSVKFSTSDLRGRRTRELRRIGRAEVSSRQPGHSSALALGPNVVSAGRPVIVAQNVQQHEFEVDAQPRVRLQLTGLMNRRQRTPPGSPSRY